MTLQLSDSTAIIILGSIAAVYFTITTACSLVICRIICKKRCAVLPDDLPPKTATQTEYKLSNMRETKGIRDNSNLIPGGRADKWRRYISSNQPVHGNGTSSQQNNGYTQERPKLPAIEEVGESEGVGMWGGEEEVETGSDDTTQREDTTTKESEIRSQWWAKRKVRGRTSSTKLLLEETDSSSWTLTSTNGTNGSSGLEDSLTLTASLPGPVLAQCGRPDVFTTPIPRPIPRHGHIPINTRSVSPVSTPTNDSITDTGTASGCGHGTQTASEVEKDNQSDESPTTTTKQNHRPHKKLSASTHSLPRHSTTSTVHKLESQQNCGSSSILPAAAGNMTGGSRPKLRRYASTSACSSTPSLEPIVLVRPRSRGSRKRDSYRSNTLARSSNISTDDNHNCSTTSIEMEMNYYTLQTRRGGDERGDNEMRSTQWTLPNESMTTTTREVLSTDHDKFSDECTSQKYSIAYRVNDSETHLPIVIDLGHDSQDSTV